MKKLDPKSNDDFDVLIDSRKIKGLEPGHDCYPVPDPSRDIEEGAKGTLQIKYQAEFDSDETETFYACADIKYVAASKFDTQVPCFNITSDEFIAPDPGKPSSGSGSNSGSDSGSSGSGSGSSKLGGGAIAGIVIGVAGGVSLLAVSYFFYRRYQQKRRIRLHELSVRNVKWDEVGNSVSGSTTTR